MSEEAPGRGFPRDEYTRRAARAQRQMLAAGLDALLLTSAANVRYFSGFDTQFWESPTRPWFLILPADGQPIAVVPEIGEAGMRATWVADVRSWPAPRPADDGVTLLTAALADLRRRHGRIGAELGHEAVLRMPLLDFERLRGALPGREFVDGSVLVRNLRFVKSEAEIDRIRHICGIVSDAFEALPDSLAAGLTERQATARMRMDVLARGADAVPFMPGVAGPGGYDNIIMGPTDRVIRSGDILVIDTGSTFDGYFSDFDRNIAFGAVDDAARRAHEVIWQATEAGIAAARPGATASAVWRAQAEVLSAGGSLGNNVGRLGHGLGLQLTEFPSNMPGDETLLVPGAVLTIEPGMAYAPGKMLVHEENIVIRDGPAELLSRRAPRELPIVT